ncbi:MAG TPA: galactokinase [Abditibacteriaceae bacterium]|jgi:galactokinase
MTIIESVEAEFSSRFGASGTTVRAPGRVNLIGEHVDYNDGFVLPMALSLETVIRFRPREDNRVVVYAPAFEAEAQFTLDHITRRDDWSDYIAGVAVELNKLGVPLRGFDGIVDSTVPMASGLSSSAALEVAAAMVFLHLAGQTMSRPEIALLCQRAENQFMGVNCGIMDQMAVAACEKNHALLLDCRSLEMRQVPFVLSTHSVVVTDSAAPRELADSAYNERRAQCEEGLAILQRSLPDAKSLRDISADELNKHIGEMTPVVGMRVRHVVEEIARTQYAVAALEGGDLQAFGVAMNASHRSLADLYEVSSPELDWLTNWACEQPGVLGSRLTGAGFGGCTVSLVANAHVKEFLENLPIQYKLAMGRDARCWVCQAASGASICA